MTEPEKCIIFRYTYQCPGLGDFIRGAIGIYMLCKERNVPFYFDITHPIGKWLEWKKYPGDISDFKQDSYHYFHSSDKILREHILHDIFASDKHIVLSNYIVYHGSELMNAGPALQSLVYPTPEFDSEYSKIIDFPVRSYICLHIRYGDCVLVRKDNHDIRIDGSDTLVDKRIERFLASVKDTTTPIYLLTDNYDQKLALSAKYGFKYFDIRPVHTSHILQSDKAYLNTLIEFMFLSRAAHVYGLSPSGFSQWGAAYGGVPYTLIQ